MEQGKKSISYGSIYDALEIISQKVSGKEAVEVFQKALENVKPVVEVKSLSFLNGAYPADQDYQVVLPAGDYKVVASTPGKASLEILLTVTATPNAQLSVSFPI
jgi:hypothetical protein